MHFAALTPVEQRVLGCLVEKRWTTPDQYPLSLNALRLACNQSTNRDPVTRYDENEVRDAAQRLSRYGLARLASGAGSRATKYRHLAEEGLGLDRDQLAVLCVLLLRGPQTLGEIKARSERMAHLGSLDDTARVLGVLNERGFARQLPRRPGQKEDRFGHLLGDETDDVAAPAAAGLSAAVTSDAGNGAHHAAETTVAPAPVAEPREGGASALEARVAALEADVASLREQLADLLG